MAEQHCEDDINDFSEEEEALFVAEEGTESENEVTALRRSQDFNLGNVALFRHSAAVERDGTQRGLVIVRKVHFMIYRNMSRHYSTLWGAAFPNSTLVPKFFCRRRCRSRRTITLSWPLFHRVAYPKTTEFSFCSI